MICGETKVAHVGETVPTESPLATVPVRSTKHGQKKREEEKKAYAVYKERYMATNAKKKALWLSYRRDNYGATKKFSG